MSASAVVIAHSVDCELLFLGGSVDDITARTHTEGIDSPAVLRLCRELIGRRGQAKRLPLLFRMHTVLIFIDEELRVKNAETDGKVLLFHRNILIEKLPEGIPRAVAGGKHGDAGMDNLLFRIISGAHEYR